MKNIESKKGLEVFLSKLGGFDKSKMMLEQYLTPSSIAAEVLWKAYLSGEIEGKVVADLGSGPGVLGIGCLLLGAERSIFLDVDPDSIEILKKNLEFLKSEGLGVDGNEVSGNWKLILGDVKEFFQKVDLVIMNPPFGTKIKHQDLVFLEQAFKVSDLIYSFHKTSTKEFVENFVLKNGYKIIERFDFSYMIKNTMMHHRKNKEYIEVSCFKIFRE